MIHFGVRALAMVLCCGCLLTSGFRLQKSPSVDDSLLELNDTAAWKRLVLYANFTLEGCGEPRANGLWIVAGKHSGRPEYTRSGDPKVVIHWSSDRKVWRLFIDNFLGVGRKTLYQSASDTQEMPLTGWEAVEGPQPAASVQLLDRSAGSRRIMIVHASIGSGHKSAGRAIQAQLKIDMPDAEVFLFDTIEEHTTQFANGLEETVTPPSHFTWFSKTMFLNTRAIAPGITDLLVEASDGRSLVDWYDMPIVGDIRRTIEHSKLTGQMSIYYNLRRFERFVLRHRWDLIIHTHFFSAMVLGQLRKFSKIHIPAITVVTDFHAHKFWIHDTDHFFVASDEVKAGLLEDHDLHVDKDAITVSGIPINPKLKTITKETARAALLADGIKLPEENGRLILALPVAESTDDCVAVWRNVLVFVERNPKHKVVFVSGRKDELKEAFLEYYNQSQTDSVTLLGFTRVLPELMAVADVISSKPGGLTTSEALASGLPFLLMQPWIIDVEKPNAKYMDEHGAAIFAPRPADVQEKLEHIFKVDSVSNEAPVDAMQRAAKSLGHPASAATISEYVQHFLGTSPQRKFAPGICCCGRPRNSWLPWTPDRHKSMCTFMHGPPLDKEPIFDAEFSQTDCHFDWGFGHEARCPSSCGRGSAFTQQEAHTTAEDCADMSEIQS